MGINTFIVLSSIPLARLAQLADALGSNPRYRGSNPRVGTEMWLWGERLPFKQFGAGSTPAISTRS